MIDIDKVKSQNIFPDFLVEELSDELTDILQKVNALKNRYFFRSDTALINQLKALTTIDLSKLLDCFFMEIVQEGCKEDPVKALERIAEIIPLDKLQESVNVKDVIEEATSMFEEAKLYLDTTQGKLSPNLQARLSSILTGILSVLETFIHTFGVGDFFKPAESNMDAMNKSHKIMMLFHLFSILSTALIPLLGAAYGGLIISGTFFSILALSMIWPWIKPMPSHLPANAELWSNPNQNRGAIAPVRKATLDKIAAIIKMNRHPILVGPSRVGKSLTAKAFAEAIERGDYPELKGMRVFRINTAALLGERNSRDGRSDILNEMSEAMGRHRHKIILVLDEIHNACKNNEKIADRLKTFLEEEGEFPHVIGITTEEEYEKYVKDNNAFCLRFDRVNIENTDLDETINILSHALLKSRSKPLVEEDALEYLFEQSQEIEKAAQPSTALRILGRCINRTQKTQKSPTEEKIVEISNKLLSLRSQAAATRGRKKASRIEIKELEEELAELQEALLEERKELEKLFKAKEFLSQTTRATYRSVLKISSLGQKALSLKNEKELKIFLLLHEFLDRALEYYIKEKAEELDVKAIIDQDLIDEEISSLKIHKEDAKNKNGAVFGLDDDDDELSDDDNDAMELD